jgi:hypothetical protein
MVPSRSAAVEIVQKELDRRNREGQRSGTEWEVVIGTADERWFGWVFQIGTKGFLQNAGPGDGMLTGPWVVCRWCMDIHRLGTNRHPDQLIRQFEAQLRQAGHSAGNS